MKELLFVTISRCIPNCRWLVGIPARAAVVVGVITDHGLEMDATIWNAHPFF